MTKLLEEMVLLFWNGSMRFHLSLPNYVHLLTAYLKSGDFESVDEVLSFLHINFSKISTNANQSDQYQQNQDIQNSFPIPSHKNQQQQQQKLYEDEDPAQKEGQEPFKQKQTKIFSNTFRRFVEESGDSIELLKVLSKHSTNTLLIETDPLIFDLLASKFISFKDYQSLSSLLSRMIQNSIPFSQKLTQILNNHISSFPHLSSTLRPFVQ
jgi:hypothetical protein